MTKEELQKFCAKAEDRPRLAVPWSEGQWTYAANGALLIRVPRLPDVPEQSRPGTLWASTLEYFDRDPWRWFEIPDVAIGVLFENELSDHACTWCDGSGREVLDGVSGACGGCNGTGSEKWDCSVTVGEIALFSRRYLYWLRELPRCELGINGALEPARIRFTGGEGLLMPRTR